MPVYFSKEYTTSSDITASGTSAEEFITENEWWENGDFDTVNITNNDSVDLRVNINGNTSNAVNVPKHSFKKLTGQTMRTFTISNLDTGTAHTAGTIKIHVENTKFPRRK